MGRSDDAPDDFFFRVRDNTRRYVKDLLHENERLREIMASLEGKRLDLEKRLIAIQADPDPQARNPAQLQQQVVEIETDSRRFNER